MTMAVLDIINNKVVYVVSELGKVIKPTLNALLHTLSKKDIAILNDLKSKALDIVSEIPHLETAINKPEISVAIFIVTILILIIVPIIVSKGKKMMNKQDKNQKYSTSNPDKLTNGKVSSSNKRDASTSNDTSKSNVPLEIKSNSQLSPNQSVTSPLTPMSVQKNNVDNFVRRLRSTGFKIQRLKKNQIKDQIFKLNSKADLTWSRSYFSKSQPINTLIDAFEADDGFILEFKKKSVHLRLRPEEHPYTSQIIVKYLNEVIKKLKTSPYFVADICKNFGSVHDDEPDDAMSVASENSHTNFSIKNNMSKNTPQKKPLQRVAE